MSLNALLHQTLEASNARFPAEAQDVIASGMAEMRQMKIEKTALGEGDYLPSATLKSATGEDVRLADLNENGPLIITFYRGGWCPYCNLELRAYQAVQDQIIKLGGQIVAITPEKPDHALTTIEQNTLDFPVLTDTSNAFAKSMGIAFELPGGLQALFRQFGMNLSDLNDDTGWALPVPATFVVDSTDRIVLADVDVDYTRRLEPTDAVAALRSCVHATAG